MESKYYATVSFVFSTAIISTTIPITDSEVNYETISKMANKVIIEDFDIDCLYSCQDYEIEISEY